MIKKYHYNYKDKLNQLISGELEEIYIPPSITEISDYSFFRCKNLEKVILTNNLTKIGESAFAQCDNLKIFIYNGTIEDWNKINKDKYWLNQMTTINPISVNIQCLDGTITV